MAKLALKKTPLEVASLVKQKLYCITFHTNQDQPRPVEPSINHTDAYDSCWYVCLRCKARLAIFYVLPCYDKVLEWLHWYAALHTIAPELWGEILQVATWTQRFPRKPSPTFRDIKFCPRRTSQRPPGHRKRSAETLQGASDAPVFSAPPTKKAIS